MMGFDEELSWFEKIQIRVEQLNYEDEMNLERVKPLVIVWQLALNQKSFKGIVLAQEGISLWVKELWGEGASVLFDRENQSIHAKHPAGISISIYAKDLNLEGL